jgi:hypothetical protein
MDFMAWKGGLVAAVLSLLVAEDGETWSTTEIMAGSQHP